MSGHDQIIVLDMPDRESDGGRFSCSGCQWPPSSMENVNAVFRCPHRAGLCVLGSSRTERTRIAFRNSVRRSIQVLP